MQYFWNLLFLLQEFSGQLHTFQKLKQILVLCFGISLHIYENLQSIALQADCQTFHCSVRLLTEVLCAKKHTEYFSMTQGAKVTYYKWIMRPNAMFWVWTKKGSIYTPLWLGHSGFYFPCTLNGAKQLAEMLYRNWEKPLYSTSDRQIQIVTLKRRQNSSYH